MFIPHIKILFTNVVVILVIGINLQLMAAEACNFCDESKENRFFASFVFVSIFAIGLVYVIVQRRL